MPALSVITVCYNAQRTILDAVKSVIESKPADLEYIVVDGASTDGTVETLGPYAHRIDRIISEPDHGIYDAMSKGVAASTGRFIAFLNADDAYLPAALPLLLDAIAKCGDQFDVVYGDWLGVGKNGSLFPRKASHRLDWKHRLCHQAMAVRRVFMLEPSGFDSRYRLCADFDLILRLRTVGARFQYLPYNLVRFDESGASNTRVRRAAWESILIAWRRIGLLRSFPFVLLTALHALRSLGTDRANSK